MTRLFIVPRMGRDFRCPELVLKVIKFLKIPITIELKVGKFGLHFFEMLYKKKLMVYGGNRNTSTGVLVII